MSYSETPNQEQKNTSMQYDIIYFVYTYFVGKLFKVYKYIYFL